MYILMGYYLFWLGFLLIFWSTIKLKASRGGGDYVDYLTWETQPGNIISENHKF